MVFVIFRFESEIVEIFPQHIKQLLAQSLWGSFELQLHEDAQCLMRGRLDGRTGTARRRAKFLRKKTADSCCCLIAARRHTLEKAQHTYSET